MKSALRIMSCGDDALRLVTSEADHRHALANALLKSGAWREVVVGRESVTVQFDPVDLSPAAATELLRSAALDVGSEPDVEPPVVTLKARTDGSSAPDLALCADANGSSVPEFIEKILGSDLRVDMLGFAPGFAYVSGVDPVLHGGRLENPRQRVPAGSIGFIEGYLGIYALEGPGGWPIIGRTQAQLFDKTAQDPFLLSPGARVNIEWD